MFGPSLIRHLFDSKAMALPRSAPKRHEELARAGPSSYLSLGLFSHAATCQGMEQLQWNNCLFDYKTVPLALCTIAVARRGGGGETKVFCNRVSECFISPETRRAIRQRGSWGILEHAIDWTSFSGWIQQEQNAAMQWLSKPVGVGGWSFGMSWAQFSCSRPLSLRQCQSQRCIASGIHYCAWARWETCPTIIKSLSMLHIL